MPRYVIRSGRTSPRPRSDLLDQLNEAQRAAVLCPGGPVLVIAGAGSGKTRTLTHRAAYLIEQGLDPKRLLLCTFTNRAARQMVQRVEELLEVQLRRLWAGTFHHVANMALRRNAERVGLPENYSILDREDALDLVAASLAEEGKALRSRRFPSPQMIAQIGSLGVNCQLGVDEALLTHAPRFYDMTEEVTRILVRYADRKLRLGLVDYDDLLVFFERLLAEGGEPARQLQEGFEHVLVDEYQDTNLLQGKIVERCAAAHGNLMVVGDDAQSIYGFRGAQIQNILGFPERFSGAKVFKLEQNYRSTPEILRLANASIALNQRQHRKVLRATRPAGMLPALLPLYDVGQQADFVAQRVLELSQEEGVGLRRIAVLYRAHSHSLELQVELTRRKIPYVVRSGLRFFEQAHIKDVVAYLRLLHNEGDTLAWQRVLKLWSGVGPRTVEKVIDGLGAAPADARKRRIGSDELIDKLPPGARPAVRQLATLLGALDPKSSPGEQIIAVLDGHYRQYAEDRFANAELRIDDLQQLADFARRYESLTDFLSELALVAGVAAEAVGPGEAPEEKLTLSTVHQAKGLEWQAVFLIGLAEGRFPQAMAIRTHAELEEERRLFHVATTRAMEQLYLCYPRFEEVGDGPRRLLRLSRFLGELNDNAPPFERWEIDQEPLEEHASGNDGR